MFATCPIPDPCLHSAQPNQDLIKSSQSFKATNEKLCIQTLDTSIIYSTIYPPSLWFIYTIVYVQYICMSICYWNLFNGLIYLFVIFKGLLMAIVKLFFHHLVGYRVLLLTSDGNPLIFWGEFGFGFFWRICQKSELISRLRILGILWITDFWECGLLILALFFKKNKKSGKKQHDIFFGLFLSHFLKLLIRSV